MVAMEHYEEYVHAVVEAGADLIVSGAGLPTDLPKYVGESDILLAPIVSTAKSANVILKYWDKKYHRIPDLVVIEGPLAGGHLGFHEEQPEAYGIDAGAEDYVKCRTSYEKEIIAIMQVIHTFSEKYGKKIPVAIGGEFMTVKAQRVHFPSEQMPYRRRQDSLQQKNAMQISAIKKPT